MFQPKIENVVSVYSGKRDYCCCGCSGKHTYTEAARGRGKELRGYDIGEDEISDRSVKTIFNKVFGGKYGPAKQNTIDDDSIYYLDTDTRTYIVYFQK